MTGQQLAMVRKRSLCVVLQHRDDEFFLVGEIRIDGAPRQSRGSSNSAYAGSADTLLLKNPSRGFEQPRACVFARRPDSHS
jgi:hypothetical protein